jgi:hypothetical protein
MFGRTRILAIIAGAAGGAVAIATWRRFRIRRWHNLLPLLPGCRPLLCSARAQLLSHAADILRTESYHPDRSEVGFGSGYLGPSTCLPTGPAPAAPRARRSPATDVVKPRHPPPTAFRGRQEEQIFSARSNNGIKGPTSIPFSRIPMASEARRPPSGCAQKARRSTSHPLPRPLAPTARAPSAREQVPSTPAPSRKKKFRRQAPPCCCRRRVPVAAAPDQWTPQCPCCRICRSLTIDRLPRRAPPPPPRPGEAAIIVLGHRPRPPELHRRPEPES